MLFPKTCLSCASEGHVFCETCADQWRPRPEQSACFVCGTTGSARVCSACALHTALDGLTYYLPYGNPLIRAMIGRWKYEGDRSVEPVIRAWMTEARLRLMPPVGSFVVSSVPAHWTRKNARGFDQSAVFAGMIAEIYGTSSPSLLVRMQKTAPQARRAHEKRQLGTMDGIFRWVGTEVPETVVLCDDVFTSGATMNAAAHCLKQAGVKYVWGLTIAKG